MDYSRSPDTTDSAAIAAVFQATPILNEGGTKDFSSRFPRGRGPQGDVIRIENLVRCVRGGEARRADSDGTGGRKP